MDLKKISMIITLAKYCIGIQKSCILWYKILYSLTNDAKIKIINNVKK